MAATIRPTITTAETTAEPTTVTTKAPATKRSTATVERAAVETRRTTTMKRPTKKPTRTTTTTSVETMAETTKGHGFHYEGGGNVPTMVLLFEVREGRGREAHQERKVCWTKQEEEGNEQNQVPICPCVNSSN